MKTITLEELFKEDEHLRNLPPLNQEHINLANTIAEKYASTYNKHYHSTKEINKQLELVDEFKKLCFKEVYETLQFSDKDWQFFLSYYSTKLYLVITAPL